MLRGPPRRVTVWIEIPGAHSRRFQDELEARLAGAQRLLDLFALGDVTTDCEYAVRRPVPPAKQHLPAIHEKVAAVAVCLPHFALPSPFPAQDFIYFRERDGSDGLQQLVKRLAGRVLFPPAVHLLRSFIPRDDPPLGIHGDDCIVRKIDQLCLPPQRFLRFCKRPEGLPQASDQQSNQRTGDQKQREHPDRVRIRDGERMAGFNKEPVHAKPAERGCRQSWPAPSEPGGDDHRESERHVRCLYPQNRIAGKAQTRGGDHGGQGEAIPPDDVEGCDSQPSPSDWFAGLERHVYILIRSIGDPLFN